MLETLQKQHRDTIAKAEAIFSLQTKTDEMVTEWEGLLGEAEKLQKQIELVQRTEKSKEWAKAPADESKGLATGGEIVVPKAFKEDKGGVAGMTTGTAARSRVSSVKNFHPSLVIDEKTGESIHRTAEEKAYRFGMWFLSAVLGQEQAAQRLPIVQKAQQFCKEHGLETKVHTDNNNAAGGSLVAPEFNNDMIDLRELYGVFRRNAKIVPMASDTRSDPRRTGGLTAYFIGEVQQMTESTKGWDRVQLTAKKIGVLTKLSSELNEDAIISIGDDLAGEIAYAFAQKEDDCGFNGDGTSTYGGITGMAKAFTNLTATIANIAGLTVAANQTASNGYGAIVLNNFIAMQGNLPQYAAARPGVKWFCHRNFYYTTMLSLALAAGGVTEAEILAAGQTEPMFLGYPVEFVQQMTKTFAVNQVCCYFGNLPLAASFGERRMTTIAVSEHLNFDFDELAVRGTERFDIVVHDVGNFSATAALRVAGPVVALITGAS